MAALRAVPSWAQGGARQLGLRPRRPETPRVSLDPRIQKLTAQFAVAPSLEIADDLCFLTHEYSATRPLEFSATHLRVAEWCLAEGHWDKAEEVLLQVFRSGPSPFYRDDLPQMLGDRAAAGVLLGRICQAQGQTELAEEFARQAAELLAQLGDPRRDEALELLGPSPEPEEPTEWQVGDVIDDLYEVTALLGQGGMGSVHRVRHRSWGADLAVKSAHPQLLATPRGAESFVREAETWVGLGSHPHLASCYYVRTLGGVPRIFAEYVEGGTLRQWIERGELQERPRVLDVAIQVAWGLAYAHERGLVHQDVKSDNVLMTPDGTARVSDFGLARAAQAGQVANAGMTPAYCSPEQSRGEALTDRTDVWSWGVVVLEMLAGEVTWMSGVAAPDVLETLDAPRSLHRLLERCFAENPPDRPGMSEVADVLVDMFTGYPRSRPEASRSSADSWNNHALSYLDLGQPQRAEEAFQKALEADPRHLQALYNQGLRHWRAGQLPDTGVLARLEPLQGRGGAPGEVDFLLGLVHRERGAADAARQSLARAERLQPHDADVRRARSQPFVAAEELHVLEQQHAVTSVALSASSRLVLSGTAKGTVDVWDASSGRRLREIRIHSDAVDGVDLTRDGSVATAVTLLYALFPFEPRRGEAKLGRRHPYRVNSVRLAADGRHVLTACSDGQVRFWGPSSTWPLKILKGHGPYVWTAIFTPDGRVLSGGADRTLRLWDLNDGSCLGVMAAEGSVVALAATNDRALVADGNQAIGIWDLREGELVGRLTGHSSRVHSVALSADGRLAVSGDHAGQVRVWELATGRCLRTFAGHRGAVRAVDLDGDLAVSCGDDGTVRVWRLPTPLAAPWRLARVRSSAEQLRLEEEVAARLREAEAALQQNDLTRALERAQRARAVEGFENTPAVLELWGRLGARCRRVRPQHLRLVRRLEAEAPILSVQCAPDGSWAVGSDARGTLHWTHRPPTLLHEGNSAHSLGLSADGRLLSVGIYGHEVVLLKVATGELWARVQPQNSQARTAALSPDGTQLLLDKAVYEVSSGRRRSKLRGHYEEVLATAWSPDGRWLATGARDHCVRLWDAESGLCRQVWPNHHDYVECVAFRPDSATLLAAAGGDVVEWDLATATSRSWEPLVEPALAMAWESGGEFAVSGGADQLVRLWDARTGRCLLAETAHAGGVTAVAWSADGRLVVSGGLAGELLVWEVDWELAPPQAPRRVEPVEAVACLEGSWPITAHRPEVRPHTVAALGEHVAAVGAVDGQIDLWDLTRNGTRKLTGHTDRIATLCPSPDGRLLLSASHDSTMRLWEVATGQCLKVFQGPRGKVLTAAWSADGQRIVSASEELGLRLWQVATGEDKLVAQGVDMWQFLHFFPNGRHALGVTRGGQLGVWDTWTGELARSLEQLGENEGLHGDCALSPDGSRAASCVGETVTLWEPGSGRQVSRLQGHTDGVTSLAFTEDGRHLLSSSSDGTVRVWDVTAGRCAQTLRGHSGPVWKVARGRGRQFWTSGTDSLQARRARHAGPADAVQAWVLAVTPPNDLYELLGVPRDVTPEALREAYEARLRESAPELHRRLRHAYQTLAEPGSRQDYEAVADSEALKEARALIQAENYAEAVAVLQAAPQTPGIALQLGLCYRILDQHERAIEVLDRLETPLAAYHAGMARLLLGRDLARAGELLESAARAEPANARPLIGLAQLSRAQRQPEQALEWVEKAVSADGRLDFEDFEALCLGLDIHLERADWRAVDRTLARIERLTGQPDERQDAARYLALQTARTAGEGNLQGALQLATAARKLGGPRPELEALGQLVDTALGLTQELDDLPESAVLARRILERELRHQLAPFRGEELAEGWSDWLQGYSPEERRAAAGHLAECPTFKAVKAGLLARLLKPT